MKIVFLVPILKPVIFFFTLVLPFAVSFAHEPPPADTWPIRFIDRPFSLTQGLRQWQVFSAASLTRTAEETSQERLFYPLIWEQGVSDAVTLIWSPFPFDLRYQFSKKERSIHAIEWSLFGPVFSRYKQFIWRPSAQYFYRYQAWPGVALELRGLVQPEVRPVIRDSSWTIGFDVQPLVQLTPRWMLGPLVGLYWEQGAPGSLYLGADPPPFETPSPRVPLGTRLAWRLAQRWEIEIDYRWFRIGYEGAFQSHQLFLSINHFY